MYCLLANFAFYHVVLLLHQSNLDYIFVWLIGVIAFVLALYSVWNQDCRLVCSFVYTHFCVVSSTYYLIFLVDWTMVSYVFYILSICFIVCIGAFFLLLFYVLGEGTLLHTVFFRYLIFPGICVALCFGIVTLLFSIFGNTAPFLLYVGRVDKIWQAVNPFSFLFRSADRSLQISDFSNRSAIGEAMTALGATMPPVRRRQLVAVCFFLVFGQSAFAAKENVCSSFYLRISRMNKPFLGDVTWGDVLSRQQGKSLAKLWESLGGVSVTFGIIVSFLANQLLLLATNFIYGKKAEVVHDRFVNLFAAIQVSLEKQTSVLQLNAQELWNAAAEQRKKKTDQAAKQTKTGRKTASK